MAQLIATFAQNKQLLLLPEPIFYKSIMVCIVIYLQTSFYRRSNTFLNLGAYDWRQWNTTKTGIDVYPQFYSKTITTGAYSFYFHNSNFVYNTNCRPWDPYDGRFDITAVGGGVTIRISDLEHLLGLGI